MATLLSRSPTRASADAHDVLRATDAGHHIPALTGVRAFAALWVLAYHVWLTERAPVLALPTWLGTLDLTPVVSGGWFGVDMFFVLSGYVLTQQAISAGVGRSVQSVDLRRYGAFITRRILRVFPAYYACLTALLLFPTFRPDPAMQAPTMADLALHLGMVHNAFLEYVSTINGVFWSLPFEWQFYLVMPFLAIGVLRGRAGTWLALAITVSVLTRVYVIRTGDTWPLAQLPVRIDEFVAGMAAASYAQSRAAARHRSALFWIGFGLLFATAVYFGATRTSWWTPDALPTFRSWCAAGGTALMLVGLSRGVRAGSALLGHPAIVWLGEISYSIYLWHVPVLVYCYERAPWREDLRAVPLALPMVAVVSAIGVSAASFYLVERPFHSGMLSARHMRSRVGWSLTILLVWAATLLGLNAR
ncbi:MAG TPA: acyltransferase [Casimicrobiaceae bacterium]|nr:acyltransferase [Casimicrobiaceae bacterium]